MAHTKRRRPRTPDSVRRTAERKARLKAAQSEAEARNAALRSAGAVPPSEALWGDLKARMAARREVRQAERRESPWRQVNGWQPGPVPQVVGATASGLSGPAWWAWDGTSVDRAQRAVRGPQ